MPDEDLTPIPGVGANVKDDVTERIKEAAEAKKARENAAPSIVKYMTIYSSFGGALFPTTSTYTYRQKKMEFQWVSFSDDRRNAH